MHTMLIIIISKFTQLPLQVHGIPEKCVVEVLAPNSTDQPFDERMRNWDVRNRLDLLDFEYPQVGEPTVESK